MILNNFIVFEGIDGAGTTTQLNRLKENGKTENFFFTAEPTSSETGKFLRKVLKGEIPISNETSAYIFAADRNEHINGTLATEGNRLVTGVKEACNSGKIVVSDRYLFSSLAYQSIDCDSEIPRALNYFFPLPQLLFFFDIDPEISLNRVLSRGGQTEIFEKIDFQKKVRVEYEKAIAEYSESSKGEGMKVVRIDATLSPDEIEKIIWDEIERTVL